MNPFQDIFDAQKSYFATGVTKTRAWRFDQLDRLAQMLNENAERLYEAISKDFKTALQEKIFEVAATLGTIEGAKARIDEWMKPQEAVIPKFLAETGHRGIVYRDPYGVTLIMGPFNGPLLLLLRPAVAALSAGNTCILKLSEALPATSNLLQELVPLYFDPRAVVTASGNRDQVTELLKLPFDFIFFTGSTKVGKIVMRAAAENITPILLELGQFIGGLSFGGGAVNQTNIHLWIETMPFGGVGAAGIGCYYGRYGYESLTHPKTILISPPDVAIDHLFPPYDMSKVQALEKWGMY
ncbi:MAG TPA: aldehyde dehydrogenase family protein [Bryobacteraceae bacterium]|jgi:aldehyde dehydrogenase (NAD+)